MCSLEDSPGEKDDRDRRLERDREFRAVPPVGLDNYIYIYKQNLALKKFKSSYSIKAINRPTNNSRDFSRKCMFFVCCISRNET